jgi:hypothetical protein
VRGGDDDAGIRLELLRQERDTGRRQDAAQQRIGTARAQALDERFLHGGPRQARVPAHDDARTGNRTSQRALAACGREGAPHLGDQLGRQVVACGATDTVGAEEFRHG